MNPLFIFLIALLLGLIFIALLVQRYGWKKAVAVGMTTSTILAGGFSMLPVGDEVGVTWWSDNAWDYCKTITINSSQVDSTLSNFPILVSISGDTDLGGHAQTDGDDLLFTLDNSTKLNHEIEYYNNDSGTVTASIWVNITTLSSSSDTKIYMYYGNQSCSSQENIAGTWNSDYGGVWHMNEINAIDSTSNDNDGTQTGTPTIDTGIVYNAVDFQGTPPSSNQDYIEVGVDDSIDLSDEDTFTWECWINFDSNAADQVFMGQQRSGASWNVVMGTYDTEVATNAIKLINRDDDGTYRDTLTSGVSITTGTWMYVAGTYNNGGTGDNKSIYIDGDLKAYTSGAANPVGTPNNLRSSAASTQFGYLGDYGACDGAIDEVRICKIVRNSSWISATYNTIIDDDFLSWGSEREYSEEGSISSEVNTISSYQQTSSPLTITATAEGSPDNVTLYYQYSSDNVSWGDGGGEREDIFTQDFENCNLLNNWSLDGTGRNTASTGTFEIQDTSTGSYDNDISSAHSGSNFAASRGSIPTSTDRRTYNRTTIDISGYEEVNISFWYTYEDTETDDYLEICYYNESGSSWVDILNIDGMEYGSWQGWSGGSWYHVEIQIPDEYKPDDLIIQWRWRTSADQERWAMDDLNVTGIPIGGGSSWEIYGVDEDSPFSWSFNFPNSTGYYEFYSIAKKSGEDDEASPVSKDTSCQYSPSSNLWETVYYGCSYGFFNISCGNTTDITISDNWVKFNNSDFNVTYRPSGKDFNATITYVASALSSQTSGAVLNFTSWVEDDGYYNLSIGGFASNMQYQVYIGEVLQNSPTSNNDGVLSTNLSLTTGAKLVHINAIKQPPIVTTNATTDITSSSATICGYLENDGGESCSTWLEWDDSDLIYECSGFVATGSVCADGRSIFLKNRHISSNNQKPNYFSGYTYDFWGVGTSGQCRMGQNEKGLSVGNLDVGSTISVGNRDYLSAEDYGEDDAMKYVLGNFDEVSEAAVWLAQHQSHDGQTVIISSETGVAAIVGKGTDGWANISYINNTYTGLCNAFYCEGANDGKVQRMNYLASRVLDGNGKDPDEPNKISQWDAIEWAKDNNASDASNPYWTEPKPDTYTGTYGFDSYITTSSSRAQAVFVGGNNSYDGALNLAWLGVGYGQDTIMLPIGCSYVDNANDLLSNWTSGDGIDQYVSATHSYTYSSSYDRGKMHEVWNYTRPLENMTLEEYDNLFDTAMTCTDSSEASERMREFCNSTSLAALEGYKDETIWISTNSTAQTGNTTGDEFSESLTSLNTGTVYYYRAWASNSEGNGNGSILSFMTLPDIPTGETSTNGSSWINLSWTKGDGAHYTVVEWDTSETWSRGDGNQIYNGTGVYFNHTGLDGGVTRYYQLWSYAAAEDLYQYSSSYATLSNTTSGFTYTTTVRADGVDYFVWLGANTSAQELDQYHTNFIPTFDEVDETIEKLGNDGVWDLWNGHGDGQNFTINTFDVLRITLNDTGTINIEMEENPDYTGAYENRTFYLIDNGDGYNYTGMSDGSGTTLGSAADAMSMANYEWIGVWDDTSFEWVFHFQGTTLNSDEPVGKWDVCITHITANRTWAQ